MGKRKQADDEGELFPEVERVLSLLSSEPQELVIIAIPSHGRKNRPLDELKVKERASAAMDLFADLYQGATAFETFQGIYKTEEGEYLRDKPILVESYATVAAIEDRDNLEQARGLCKTTR